MSDSDAFRLSVENAKLKNAIKSLQVLLQYEGLIVEYMGGMGNLDAEQRTQQQFNTARAALAALDATE